MILKIKYTVGERSKRKKLKINFCKKEKNHKWIILNIIKNYLMLLNHRRFHVEKKRK